MLSRDGAPRPGLVAADEIGTGIFATADFPGFSSFPLGASPVFSQPLCVGTVPEVSRQTHGAPGKVRIFFLDVWDESRYHRHGFQQTTGWALVIVAYRHIPQAKCPAKYRGHWQKP
jgi:hypothetical protein